MYTKSKLKGLIIGHALGDAMGAFFEFRCLISKEEVRDFIKNKNYKINFMKRDTKWDWTDDTDQLILIMDLINEGDINNITLFAKKLQNWVNNGFSEFGDTKGEGCGGHSFTVITHPDFISNPIEVSKNKYNETGSAANGSLMRTSILATLKKKYNEILKYTEIISQVTHYSELCTIACQVQVTLLLGVLYDIDENKIYKLVEKLVNKNEESLKYYNKSNNLDLIILNDTTMGYCMKTMAVGLWSYRNRDRPFLCIMGEIIYRGGDTDTNCCVAGAIIGAYKGIENIPEEWINKMPHINWLKEKINNFEIL